MAKLHLDIGEGDTVRIGDAIIRMERKSGRKARFLIEADASVIVELQRPDKSSGFGTKENSRMSATAKGNDSWQEPLSG